MSWVQWLKPGAEPNADHERLIVLMTLCHQTATIENNNASSAALILAASTGASLWHSVAAAMMTFGDMHGPITGARTTIYRTDEAETLERAENGEIIPGWGNAFFRGQLDPAWPQMDHLIREEYPEHYKRMYRVGELIFKATGKVLYPNASSFTAVVSEIVGLEYGTEPMLAITARLPAWSTQFRSVAP